VSHTLTFFSAFRLVVLRLGLSEIAFTEKRIINAVNKVIQLYEQKQTAPERAAMLDDYITRWLRWVNAGIVGKSVNVVF